MTAAFEQSQAPAAGHPEALGVAGDVGGEGTERTGGRRRRRGGRGGRERDEVRTGESEGRPIDAPSEEAVAAIDAGGLADATGDTVDEGTAGAEGEHRAEGERRPRSRGGRDRQRRERSLEEGGAATRSGERSEGASGDMAERRPSPEEVARFEPGPRVVSIGEENAEPGEASSLGAIALAAMPDVAATGVAPQPVELPPEQQAAPEPFVLPLGTLEAIAESAGLQWVNSDAEKIRAARDAMAREPAPIHVPRERKPVERVDEGPLVLVETRKDLSQVKLPFETAQQETQSGR